MKKNSPLASNDPLALLGGLTASQFLAEYWQKKPLLVRDAMPDFTGLLSPNEMAGLACEDDVQSRLIQCKAGEWYVENGPFNEDDFAKLPEDHWTLLVQSLNHHLVEASDLLKEFRFVPYSRLDDLMVSYAPDGGGVGPHFDSYDVFLLQGMGQRLWRISEQTDLTLIEGAPLKILKQFNTEQEFLLNPGDMLYLPPKVAHWGIAVGECMTYSIGFRAPAIQELASQFLLYMHERIGLLGMYSDPDLTVQSHPAEIQQAMIAQVGQRMSEITWTETDIADFLGCYLSEPKSHIVFDPPKAMSLATFTKRAHSSGLSLGLKSQALFQANRFYLNGEQIEMAEQWRVFLMKLADDRALSKEDCALCATQSPDLVSLMHGWYVAGYLEIGT